MDTDIVCLWPEYLDRTEDIQKDAALGSSMQFSVRTIFFRIQFEVSLECNTEPNAEWSVYTRDYTIFFFP